MTEKTVEIKNLSYSYPDKTDVLSGIDLDLFKGESLGVIGPNGAGKSTLLLHINGILRGKGDIKVLGLEMSDKNLRQIRSKVGLVFQEPDNQLFMPTVFEDVAFGPINMGMSKDEVDGAVREALSKVDMSDSVKRLSHHLSYGEKKRVSVATVLSMSPEILVLDEPTSNLDPKHRRILIGILKELKISKIIATHDLELVSETCSRVILLDKGKVVASGNAADILIDRILLEAHSLELPHFRGFLAKADK
ncbi:MAG: ABC transporter ATP-binding protein [Candidatus Omnitrophota bacterium]|nr:ABC transporter ATP-binding protein [Candidatus Omnitrophota bacterium]